MKSEKLRLFSQNSGAFYLVKFNLLLVFFCVDIVLFQLHRKTLTGNSQLSCATGNISFGGGNGKKQDFFFVGIDHGIDITVKADIGSIRFLFVIAEGKYILSLGNIADFLTEMLL